MTYSNDLWMETLFFKGYIELTFANVQCQIVAILPGPQYGKKANVTTDIFYLK